MILSPLELRAQFKFPKIPKPSIPGGLKVPEFGNLFKEEEAVSTSIKDARGEISYLDDYNPENFKPLTSLKRGPNGGWLLRPGLYSGDIRTYCLHAGTYGPTRGNGYLYAPLKGKRSKIIRKILHNSADHPNVPQQNIQALIWAIESRAKFDSLSVDLKSAATTLLSEQDILELNGMSVDYLTDQVKDQAFGKLNTVLRPIYEAQNNLRGMLTTQINTPFSQLEKVAVLVGDPPKDKNSREIPGGRWTLHPSGFFVRYIPSSYSRTKMQIYVPERFEIKRDAKGRIVSVRDARGNSVETDYNDAIAPLSTTGKGLQGYSFTSIRLFQAGAASENGKSALEYKSTGWTFTGVPTGRGFNVSTSTDYPDSATRLQKSIELLRLTDDFKRSAGRREASWSNPADVIDLANYKEGIAASLRGDDAFTKRSLDMLMQAWQSTMRHWAISMQADAGVEAVAKDSNPASNPIASDVENNSRTAIEPDADDIEFDPSDDVATPGNTSCQRLGQSPVTTEPPTSDWILVSVQGTGASVPAGYIMVPPKTGVELWEKLNDEGDPDYVTVVHLHQNGLYSVTGDTLAGNLINDPFVDDFWSRSEKMTSNHAVKVVVNGSFFKGEDQSELWFGLKSNGTMIAQPTYQNAPNARVFCFGVNTASIQPDPRIAYSDGTIANAIGLLDVDAPNREGLLPGLLGYNRVPRTLIGITDGGSTVLFFSSDGETKSGAKNALIDFKATSIAQLDGGGSVLLVWDGRMLIKPKRPRLPAVIAIGGVP